jgi:hypothetical protein
MILVNLDLVINNFDLPIVFILMYRLYVLLHDFYLNFFYFKFSLIEDCFVFRHFIDMIFDFCFVE